MMCQTCPNIPPMQCRSSLERIWITSTLGIPSGVWWLGIRRLVFSSPRLHAVTLDMQSSGEVSIDYCSSCINACCCRSRLTCCKSTVPVLPMLRVMCACDPLAKRTRQDQASSRTIHEEFSLKVPRQKEKKTTSEKKRATSRIDAGMGHWKTH